MRRAAVAFFAAIPLCLALVTPVAGQQPLASQFLVNTRTQGYQFSPATAMNAGGSTAIVWSSQFGSSTEAIFLQRFDGAGARVGSEIRVDDPAFQPFTVNKRRDPAVAMDDTGNIFVVWAAGVMSYGTQFDYFFDYAQIYGQRFDASGNPRGTNFIVNTSYNNGPYEWPSVAMYASGESVVAWSGYGDGNGKGVLMQRFDASGTKQGALTCTNYQQLPAACDSVVNTFVTGLQWKPRVAANPAVCGGAPPLLCTLGDFVVIWEGMGPGGDGADIFAQMFGANGLKSGAQFRVNTYTSNTQELASVSMDASGNFVVTWIGDALPSGRGVFGQRFGTSSGPCPPIGCAATFGPLGPEFQVASLVGGSNHFTRASVGAATTGGFVVVWNDVDNNSANDAIFGRDYDAAGIALGAQFQVSGPPAATYYRPAVAVNPTGQFMVTWEGGNDGGGDFGIWARRFGPVAASDTTPPVITANISGTLGANGWYTSNVTVTWTVTDLESPVTSPPCGSSVVTTDTIGMTFTCTAISGGGTNSSSTTIKRDATPPTANLAVSSGTPGSNGWYVSNVTVSTSGTDTISGPVSCTADQTLTADTSGQAFAGSCTNLAGLTTTAATLTVKRDATPPTASLAVTGGTLGNGGWYVSDVTLTTSGADTVSGPVACTPSQTLTMDTSGQVFAGSCTNLAGLSTSASPLTVKLDKSAPTIAITSPTSGAEYSLNQAVTASYTCTDTLSGIATAGCTGSVSSGTNLDTASVGTKTFAVTALDAAGNTATQSLTYTVSCHVVTISASPSPVTQGGFVTVRTTLTSCGAPTRTIALRFTLSGPPQSVGCFSVNSTIFTTGSFVLPANTQQTFNLPALWIPTLLCPGTYSITATTLIAGQPVDSVTTTLVVIHR